MKSKIVYTNNRDEYNRLVDLKKKDINKYKKLCQRILVKDIEYHSKKEMLDKYLNTIFFVKDDESHAFIKIYNDEVWLHIESWANNLNEHLRNVEYSISFINKQYNDILETENFIVELIN